MPSAQRPRLGVFAPGGLLSNDDEAVGNLGAIAQRTAQRRADVLLARPLVVDPRRRPEGWAMPDVLTVMAVQQGDPIAGVIALESRYPALHQAERTEADRYVAGVDQ